MTPMTWIRRRSPRLPGAVARRRSCDERGTTIVEAAFVTPVLVLLIFGIIEFGGVMLAFTTTSNTIHTGVRTGAAAANSTAADALILSRMGKEAAGLSNGEINYVIIWHATGAGDTVPAGCVTAADAAASTPSNQTVGVASTALSPPTNGTLPGGCNVYVAPQTASTGAFARASLPSASGTPTSANSNYYFGCAGTTDARAAHMLDCDWAPTSRYAQDPGPTAADQTKFPDYLGIYIKAQHHSYTGLILNTTTFTKSVISPLEPQSYATL